MGNMPERSSAALAISTMVPVMACAGNASMRISPLSPIFTLTISRSASAARTTKPRALSPNSSTGVPAATSSRSSTSLRSTTPSRGAVITE